MVRSLVALAGGAIAGGAAVMLLAGGTGISPEPRDAPVPAGQGADDGAALLSSIRQAAAAPASIRRDIELAALIQQIAESDPARAVEIARNEYLETHFLESLYEYWARTDPDGALASLDQFASMVDRRSLALAVLRGWDTDATTGIGRALAALGDMDPLGFEVDALADLAERDPAGALQAVFSGDRGETELLQFSEVVRRAALTDPALTLQLIDAFEVSTGPALRQEAVVAWASIEPDAVLDWLGSADVSQYRLDESLLAPLADLDPDRLLATIDTFPAFVRNPAIIAIARSIARRDAAVAASLFAARYGGPHDYVRDLFLRDLGRDWGRQDPEGALAWAEDQGADSQLALSGVLNGIVDRDVGLAIGMLDRFESGMQAELLLRIARQLAAADMPRAIFEIDQHRNRPGYRSAHNLIVRELAFRDPAAAGGMMLDAPPNAYAQYAPGPFSPVAAIVENWLQQDRAALLTWAAAIPQSRPQAEAMYLIAERWASSDPTGARQWAVTVAPDAARDAALTAIIRTRAGIGVFESGLLDSFSSRAAAEASAANALVELARREPAEAERLANSLLTDAAVRQGTLQRIGELW